MTMRQGFVAQQRMPARTEQRKIERYRGMTEVMSVAKEIEFALILTPMVLMNHPNPAKNLAARESNKAQRLAGSKTCCPYFCSAAAAQQIEMAIGMQPKTGTATSCAQLALGDLANPAGERDQLRVGSGVAAGSRPGLTTEIRDIDRDL